MKNDPTRPVFFLGVVLSSVLVLACTSPVGKTEVVRDSGVLSDAGLERAGELVREEKVSGSDGGAEAGHPESVAEVGPEKVAERPANPEPVRMGITSWMVSTLPNTAALNRLQGVIAKNTFKMPVTPGKYLDSFWTPQSLDSKFQFPKYTVGSTVYAAALIKVAEDTRLIARFDSVVSVHHGGVWLPGDLYGSGGLRLPLLLKKGDNTIVIRLLTTRGKQAIVEFWRAPEPLFFNGKDLTVGHFVVGQKVEQCVGVPVLHFGESPLLGVKAEVVESEFFEGTTLELGGLPGGATTQVAFWLKPKKAFEKEDVTYSVRLRLSGKGLVQPVEWWFESKIVKSGIPYLRSRVSKVDGSCQHYAVNPPEKIEPGKKLALVLSLHGAGVGALGQARSYASKDWALLIAPTNRRPFGFDWEAWGRLDGLEALAHAKQNYPIDLNRVYVTGHSMGGHGTWQFGVLFPGRFAVVGPSAGWSSFYSYTGRSRPTGPFARSQASSDSLKYIDNLARRAVYIIHGSADTNVPVREGRAMFDAVKKVTQEAEYHEEPGAGHWWNKKETPGADCVDWAPLFALMKGKTLDPFELAFGFTTPGAWVSPSHSYATIRTQKDPFKDISLTSTTTGKSVTLTTDNVYSMVLDGKALRDKGIEDIKVDGQEVKVSGAPIEIGPNDGKRPGVHGPFNELLHLPTCLILPDNGPEVYRHFAAFLTTNWSFIGNGQFGCSMLYSQISDEIRSKYNLLYLGIPSSKLGVVPDAVSWEGAGVKIGANSYQDVMISVVFPEKGRLSGAMYAAPGFEHLLFRIMPFTSSFALPDYFVLSEKGGVTGGFFDASWKYDKAFQR